MNDIGFNGDVLVDGDMTSVIGCAAVRLTNLSLYLSIYIYYKTIGWQWGQLGVWCTFVLTLRYDMAMPAQRSKYDQPKYLARFEGLLVH